MKLREPPTSARVQHLATILAGPSQQPQLTAIPAVLNGPTPAPQPAQQRPAPHEISVESCPDDSELDDDDDRQG